ncbi:outer membrane lipoprotein carrier protein LolA, partial [Acinetobacter baumannii]
TPYLKLPSGFSLSRFLKQVQSLLESLKTFQGRLREVSADGTIRTGSILVQRPGQMRIEYGTPGRMVIVSDGVWVGVLDGDLEETNYYPLS